MNTRLADFIAARAAESYPEPRTTGHDGITAQMAALVAVHLQPGARVLDAGCGQGPAMEWFEAHGFKPHGITTNDDDFKACAFKGMDVSRCDMHDLAKWMSNFPFDLVWARHVLEHSVAPFFVLHEFARVLKPGGILYAEMPDPQTACNHWSNPNHYSVLTVEMWQSLIERAGFGILEIREIKLKTGAGPDLYHSIIARKK